MINEKLDLFFIDKENQKVDLVYYNPDSNSGGQFVIINFTYEDIKKSSECCSTSGKFFDYFILYGNTYLEDIGTPAFESEKKRFNSGTHDFTGLTKETMNSLIEISKNVDIGMDL